MTALIHNTEAQRLKTLYDYEVLDTNPEPIFDQITQLTAKMFKVPIVLISLVDEDRQWFKSKVGVEVAQTSREESFCAVAIQRDETMIIPDATQDPRFADNALVVGEPNIRFYAGANLTSPTGHKLGTLCILDRQPRTLSKKEITLLNEQAAIVMELLNLRLNSLKTKFVEAKKTQFALHQLEERFEKVFYASPIAISISTLAEGRILAANNSFLNLFRHTREEVIGHTGLELGFWFELEERITIIKPLLANKRVHDLELSLVSKTGEIRHALSSFELIEFDGELCLLTLLHDITRRKQAEKLIEERDHLLNGIFQSLSAQMAVLDKDGIITYVSKSWEKFTLDNGGDQASNGVGVNYLAKCHQAVKLDPSIKEVIEGMQAVLERKQAAFRHTYCCEINDGVLWFVMQVDPMPLEHGGIVITHTNITERKKMEAEIIEREKLAHELRETLAKEKELGDLKARFVSMTSHEFRTPLSTIMTSAELLEHYPWSDKKRYEHFRRIETSIDHMTSMLEDVLLMGRAETGNLSFNPVILNLDSFCRDVVEELQLGAASKHCLNYENDCEQENALVDEKLLRQILINLISNAAKYSPPQSNIKFSLSCTADTVIFEVNDEGIGILAEDQLHLFEIFHRGQNVGNKPGTGLGLAIVKKCVDAHGGKIEYSSAANKGSNFRVTLPIGRS